MKFALLFACVCVLGLLASMPVSALNREVRSYVSEMEYVDHVDQAHSSLVETKNAQHSAPAAAHNEEGPHFIIENETEGASPFSFLESESEDNQVNTDVLRTMAGEMAESAAAVLELADADTENAVFLEMETETEDPAADLAAKLAELAKAAAVDDAAEKTENAASEADKAQSKADAEKAAAQAALDKAQAEADATALAAAKSTAEREALQKSAAAATAAAAAAPAAAASTATSTVVLPGDFSAEHTELLRANNAATTTVRGAIGEVASILTAKDATIRSLVANVTYLANSVHKLAAQVDLQRTFITLQGQKLANAVARNQQLSAHAASAAAAVVAAKEQLKSVEVRLAAHDASATKLDTYLKANEDKVTLPAIPETVNVQGAIAGSALAAARLAFNGQSAVPVSQSAPTVFTNNPRLHAVAGTETWAVSDGSLPTHTIVHVPVTHHTVTTVHSVERPRYYPRALRSVIYANAPSAQFSRPASFFPNNIPTVVVEASDDGR